MPQIAAAGAEPSVSMQQRAQHQHLSSQCQNVRRHTRIIPETGCSRRRLPQTLCGEARSANRSRWATGDGGGLGTAHLEASRSEALQDAAGPDSMVVAAKPPILMPPVASGNAAPAMKIPAMTADAAALIVCASLPLAQNQRISRLEEQMMSAPSLRLRFYDPE